MFMNNEIRSQLNITEILFSLNQSKVFTTYGHTEIIHLVNLVFLKRKVKTCLNVNAMYELKALYKEATTLQKCPKDLLHAVIFY